MIDLLKKKNNSLSRKSLYSKSHFLDNALDIQKFLKASIELGVSFIECGGSVSRFESLITKAGESLNFETSVQATPSTLLIGVYEFGSENNFLESKRLQSSSIDLSSLRTLGRWLHLFSEQKISSETLLKRLASFRMKERKPNLVLQIIAIFGIGFSTAILSGAPPIQALVAGAITLLSLLVVNSLNLLLSLNHFFKVFLICFIGLGVSIIISSVLGWPFLLLSLGVLVYVVPGLLMTTAISEIVDQHYLSGCIRLLKAMAIFLAMGMAYYTVTDLTSFLSVDNVNSPQANKWPIADNLAAKMFFTLLMTLFFSVEFKAHKNSILRILVCAFAGSSIFFTLSFFGHAYINAFLASMVMGFLCSLFSKKYNYPSQIYSVPSVLSLVPGMLAFSTFSQNGSQTGESPIIAALITSLAIVFGLAIGNKNAIPEV